MSRRIELGRWLVIAAWSLSLAPQAFGAVPTAAHRDSVSSILREAAQRGQLEGLRWPRFPNCREPLQSLYSRSGWSPIWSTEGHPTANAHQAIQVLQAADERGLHPADYDVEPLAHRFQALSGTSSPSAREIGRAHV